MWVAFLIGCAGNSMLELPSSEVSPYTRTLVGGAIDGVSASDASVVVAQQGAWQWIDSAGDSDILFPWTGRVRGAAHVGFDRFVLADLVTVVRGQSAVDAELADLLPGAPEGLCGDGDAVWVQTDQGVVLWRAGILAALNADGQAVPGPLACGGSLFGERVAWLAHGQRVHAFAGNGVTWAIFETHAFEDSVQSIAVDGLGGAWVVAAGRLHLRTSEDWLEVDLHAQVSRVHGGRGSSGVWIETDDGLRWVDREGIATPTSGAGIDTVAIGDLQTDAVGRLLVVDDEGLHRVAVDRPLWMDGPLEGAVVAQPLRVSVAPTAPEEVTALSLQLLGGASPVDISLTEGEGVFDPQGITAGAYVLRATAEYPDRTASTERNIEVLPVGEINWTEHIQAIHEASCAVCHTGSTETLLDGPQAWEDRIEDVVNNVTSGSMPLGGPALSPTEIALIRAWRDGGFPR